MLRIQIKGPLEIDHITAEVLEHLCSYDLHKWFEEHCSQKFTVGKLRDALQELGQQCHTINEAMKVATMAVNTRNNRVTRDASVWDSNRMVEAEKLALPISNMSEADRQVALDDLLAKGDHMLYQLTLGRLKMIDMEVERQMDEAERSQSKAALNVVTTPDAIENPPTKPKGC